MTKDEVVLAAELATMHETLLSLITKLRHTRLSKAQSKLLNDALKEVHRSQAASELWESIHPS